ncbi:hypothetical protein [Terricaulis sp.]|uniref:hypothetical protein n=1 Tax=Terricaulis sp. TaxID=2768686 RepID=UPI00378490BB
MRRLFLHIGWSKTGTTAIQRTLEENRGRLAEAGFTYPGRERHHAALFRTLTRTLPGVNAAREAARTITEMRAAPGDLIISSEGFASLPAGLVRVFFALPRTRVIVVAYVREQADRFASHYQQQVKADLESRTFAEFAAPLQIDWTPLLDDWAAAFGRENLIVRTYDDDVVSDFLDVLGVDAGALDIPAGDPNPSIGGALLEAKRRFNAGFDGDWRALQKLLYPVLLELANAYPDYRGRVGASAALIESIRARHRASNETLARKYLDRAAAFPDRPWPTTPVFTERDVAEAWREVERRLPELTQRMKESA